MPFVQDSLYHLTLLKTSPQINSKKMTRSGEGGGGPSRVLRYALEPISREGSSTYVLR